MATSQSDSETDKEIAKSWDPMLNRAGAANNSPRDSPRASPVNVAKGTPQTPPSIPPQSGGPSEWEVAGDMIRATKKGRFSDKDHVAAKPAAAAPQSPAASVQSPASQSSQAKMAHCRFNCGVRNRAIADMANTGALKYPNWACRPCGASYQALNRRRKADPDYGAWVDKLEAKEYTREIVRLRIREDPGNIMELCLDSRDERKKGGGQVRVRAEAIG